MRIQSRLSMTVLAADPFATLNDAQWQLSGEVVLMTLLGGLGTILGPIVGASVAISPQSTPIAALRSRPKIWNEAANTVGIIGGSTPSFTFG